MKIFVIFGENVAILQEFSYNFSKAKSEYVESYDK